MVCCLWINNSYEKKTDFYVSFLFLSAILNTHLVAALLHPAFLGNHDFLLRFSQVQVQIFISAKYPSHINIRTEVELSLKSLRWPWDTVHMSGFTPCMFWEGEKKNE